MAIEASTSSPLMMHHRPYRMYTTRMSVQDLYPIFEEENETQQQQSMLPRRLLRVALIVASIAFVAILSFSAVYTQRRAFDGRNDDGHPRGMRSHYHFPAFDSRNRYTKQKQKKSNCSDGMYSKRTLKTAYEMPFAALFTDNRGQKKYEASSVIVVDDNVYAVCDSSWAISKFGRSLQAFSSENVQIGDPNREPEDSGYEALFYDEGIFYVVRESVDIGDGKAESYHAIIEELSMTEDDYDVVQTCPSEFEFEGSSKGFEGAIAIRDTDNELVVLGLCEGNYCSEKYKNDKGHGRVIAMKKHEKEDGTCTWKTVKQINIPSSANFRDYSAITMDSKGRVAITSQEESQLWMGYMVGQADDGRWDLNAMAFDASDAKVFDFPKNDDCKTIYCNIEGIHWIDDNMLMAVSDKMKSRGKQPFRCFEKDESVHAFVLPK